LTRANLLLIMGGAMNVDDEEKYPWLHKEKKLIHEFIANKGKVIGICLGAQLIASALGAKVYPAAQKEIGFFPVHFTEAAAASELFNVFPKQLTVFHWHGDTFDLPPHATLIASSKGVLNQAFVIDNRIAGFQFHPEATNTTVQGMLQNDGHELKDPGEYVQSEQQLVRSLQQQDGKVQTSFFKFLDRFTNKPLMKTT
jgi:GMP synthase-like glutamine amidotransferase